MELQARSRHWPWTTPDWSAAIVAGLAAGALLMVLDLCWPLLLGDGNPWATSHQVAALLLGQRALQSTGFELDIVVTALLIHYSLGVFSGVVIGGTIAALRYESTLAMAPALGAVFGFVIYWVNFYWLTPLFPWFAELRGGSAFVGHIVFGMSAALVYCRLSRKAAAA
jgi:hypothetical protein